ncbi:MAG: flagellar basal body-associated FliL family protein [Rhodospirillales bacterium]|nr:flagellar basal body-associated FliL family protein [Rhodospirillales bacterium]
MKIVVIAFALLMMITGGTVSTMKWLKLGPFAEKSPDEVQAVKVPTGPPVFIDMDPLVVTIFQGDRVAALIQIQLKLETVGNENTVRVQRAMPRLSDAFLRELHAFIPRLLKKEENLDILVIKKRLQMVADKVASPGTVRNVLIQSVTETPAASG